MYGTKKKTKDEQVWLFETKSTLLKNDAKNNFVIMGCLRLENNQTILGHLYRLLFIYLESLTIWAHSRY